ncbi:efflux RND transporter periplasmic adaptor subunit [Vibrio sp. 10N.261.55.A7]|uniref:efflux RND transporter periplasmic adaptor subunit n=1 Tax=Vibrio sp. 10N.261.55.A7 TaxID=1880851 RepID=UPI000C84A914|nr:efflux RND transporter periplasmic adaptor subunit [Vibrio sp. 10N.261.55.A7]PMJ90493.1 efflux transporter periplasmic adaptor subunit [Vibrio sp. 10N.261.55.A7]
MKNKIIIKLLALSILTSTSLAHAKRSQGNQAVTVITEEVQVHQVSQSLTLVGKLEAKQAIVVSPEVAGKVTQIPVKANQTVQKGQLLVQLNDDKAKAAEKEAKAYLTDEQRKLREFERLSKSNAITQTSIDGQKASVEIAQARLDAAQANLQDLNLSAPFTGTIGFIDLSPGELVTAGSHLLTLDDLSVMQLDLLVPERYLSRLSQGMKVSITTSAWGNRTFDGELVGIDSRVNTETLNLRVRVNFDNPESVLKPGMLASAYMAFSTIEAPIIPAQALEYSGTKRFVYVIGDDNVAKRTEVILAERVENQVVIAEGVEIGEKIVVQGIVNMRDGVSVTELDIEKSALEKESN